MLLISTRLLFISSLFRFACSIYRYNKYSVLLLVVFCLHVPIATFTSKRVEAIDKKASSYAARAHRAASPPTSRRRRDAWKKETDRDARCLARVEAAASPLTRSIDLQRVKPNNIFFFLTRPVRSLAGWYPVLVRVWYPRLLGVVVREQDLCRCQVPFHMQSRSIDRSIECVLLASSSRLVVVHGYQTPPGPRRASFFYRQHCPFLPPNHGCVLARSPTPQGNTGATNVRNRRMHARTERVLRVSVYSDEPNATYLGGMIMNAR